MKPQLHYTLPCRLKHKLPVLDNAADRRAFCAGGITSGCILRICHIGTEVDSPLSGSIPLPQPCVSCLLNGSGVLESVPVCTPSNLARSWSFPRQRRLERQVSRSIRWQTFPGLLVFNIEQQVSKQQHKSHTFRIQTHSLSKHDSNGPKTIVCRRTQ